MKKYKKYIFELRSGKTFIGTATQFVGEKWLNREDVITVSDFDTLEKIDFSDLKHATNKKEFIKNLNK